MRIAGILDMMLDTVYSERVHIYYFWLCLLWHVKGTAVTHTTEYIDLALDSFVKEIILTAHCWLYRQRK